MLRTILKLYCRWNFPLSILSYVALDCWMTMISPQKCLLQQGTTTNLSENWNVGVFWSSTSNLPLFRRITDLWWNIISQKGQMVSPLCSCTVNCLRFSCKNCCIEQKIQFRTTRIIFLPPVAVCLFAYCFFSWHFVCLSMYSCQFSVEFHVLGSRNSVICRCRCTGRHGHWGSFPNSYCWSMRKVASSRRALLWE